MKGLVSRLLAARRGVIGASAARGTAQWPRKATAGTRLRSACGATFPYSGILTGRQGAEDDHRRGPAAASRSAFHDGDLGARGEEAACSTRHTLDALQGLLGLTALTWYVHAGRRPDERTSTSRANSCQGSPERLTTTSGGTMFRTHRTRSAFTRSSKNIQAAPLSNVGVGELGPITYATLSVPGSNTAKFGDTIRCRWNRRRGTRATISSMRQAFYVRRVPRLQHGHADPAAGECPTRPASTPCAPPPRDPSTLVSGLPAARSQAREPASNTISPAVSAKVVGLRHFVHDGRKAIRTTSDLTDRYLDRNGNRISGRLRAGRGTGRRQSSRAQRRRVQWVKAAVTPA